MGLTMNILREKDAKRLAMQKAAANGHDMRPWRRQPSAHFYNRSTCKRCGHDLLVVSKMMEPDEADRMKNARTIIGAFERDTTGADFTCVSGGALIRCAGR